MEKTIEQLEADVQAARTDLERAAALNALARRLQYRVPQRSQNLAGEAHSLAEAHRDSQDAEWKKELADSLCVLSLGSLLVSQYDLCLERGRQAIALYEELEPVHGERSRAGKAEVLACASQALMNKGEHAGALARVEESLAISRTLGDRRLEARALNNMGNVHYQEGEYAKALGLQQEAQALFRAAGDKQGEASALNNTGVCQDALGNLTAALECHLRSLAIRREIGDRHGESASLNNIGVLHVSLGNYDKALECLGESAKIMRAIGDRSREANSLDSIADVYTRLKDYPKALEYARQTLQINEEIGDQAGISSACVSIGSILCRSGSHEEGLEYLLRAFALSRKLGLRHEECVCLSRIGEIYAQEPEAARKLPTGRLAHQLEMEYSPGSSLWAHCLERALAIAREFSMKDSLCEVHFHLSELHKRLGNFEKALEHLEEHETLKEEVFTEEAKRKVANLRIVFQAESSRREAEMQEQKNEELAAISEQLTREISARKKAEEQWRRLEQMAGQARKMKSLNIMAGSVAHNFNNLLTGVLGNLELALGRLAKGMPARQMVEEAEKAASRAAELSQTMLLYVGQGREMPRAIDLSSLVKETLEDYHPSAAGKAAIRCDLPGGLASLLGGPSQIRRVVLNLLANAYEALGDSGGTITVSANAVQCDRDFLLQTYLYEDQPPGAYICLEVSDTGCGMDKATVERIFDPFFSTKATGRGLGLAAVLGIVRGHRGAVSISSEIGKGSTFRVFFPALSFAAPSAAPRTGADAARWKGHGTVLLVDDEEMVRSVGVRMLERAGFKVLTASSGLEAVVVLRSHREEISCVLLDLTMSDIGGAEAFAELRNIRGDLPVVISSGYDRASVMARFGGQKPTGFLRKPYQSRDLIAELRNALESRGAS